MPRLIGVRVRRFQSAQPDDPSNDRIAAWRVRLQNFTGKPAVMENGADRRVVANFLSNLERAERRRHRAPIIAKSEFGGRDWINCGTAAVVDEHQFLIADTDNDVRLDVTARRNGRLHLARPQQLRETNEGETWVWAFRGAEWAVRPEARQAPCRCSS